MVIKSRQKVDTRIARFRNCDTKMSMEFSSKYTSLPSTVAYGMDKDMSNSHAWSSG